jgi:hypothetical protein
MSTTSLVFAAIAAAVVWWFSRHPARPGPLSPIPTIPTIPGRPIEVPADWQTYQLPAPSPAPQGLNPILLGAILLPWGLIAWSNLSRPEPKPDTRPAVEGIDLRGKFVGEHAAEDAATVAVLTLQTADAIHDDGQIDFDGDGPIDEPRLLTGRQIWELRNLMRSYHTGGELLGDRQPKVRDEIKKYLDERCGKSSGPVTPETKAVWENAFRVINRAAVEAAR